MDNIHRQGVEVYGAVRLDWMSANSYYFYDPDGNLLEFWSPGVESRAPMPVQDS
jgi:catechol 2,3-dioxygenase-like lactoylglutathione lyase family enzyme